MRATAAFAGAALLVFSAAASDRLPDRMRVHDGDTFAAAIRVENIDAPEIDGKCDYEKALAIKARDFASSWLAHNAHDIVIRVSKVDRYGRLVATVQTPGGVDLGRALIAAKLARPWTGKRQPWC